LQFVFPFSSAQVWRQKTEDTILSLSESSAKVAVNLQESSKIQDTIVQNQIQTLEYQVWLLWMLLIRVPHKSTLGSKFNRVLYTHSNPKRIC